MFEKVNQALDGALLAQYLDAYNMAKTQSAMWREAALTLSEGDDRLVYGAVAATANAYTVLGLVLGERIVALQEAMAEAPRTPPSQGQS